MARNTRLVLGSVLGLFAVLGSSWLLLLGTDDRPGRFQEERLLAVRWRAGTVQQYRLQVDSSVQIATHGGAPEPFSQKVEGVLEVRTLAAEPEGVRVGMRLFPVDLRVAGVSDPETNVRLAAPFRVRFEPNGLPTGFEFGARIDAQHRALLEELVRTFQLAIQDRTTWAAEESHGTGTYMAEYARTEPLRMRKTKRRYVSSGQPADRSPVVEVVASSGSVRFDPERDWIGEMVVDETLTMEESSGVIVHVTTHAALELLPASTEPGEAPPDLWAFAATVSPSATAVARRQSPRPDLAPGQLERELLLSLEALDAATDGRSFWIHRMRDLLLENEELAFLLLDRLEVQELEDRTRADLYLVFELAGTPKAQEALCRVVADPSWTQRDGLRALVALGGIAIPTEESMSMLWGTSQSRSSAETEELANTAALALGSLGNRMYAEELDGYAELRQGLTNAALTARDAREMAISLMALGNTADPSLSLEVVPFLDHGDARVRTAAAQALGKLGTDDVASELVQRLQREGSSPVRASIAGALTTWTTPSPEAMESIRGTVGGERDDVARFHMARFLGQNLMEFPENSHALQDLLRSEQSNQIRRYIGETLAQTGSADRI